MSQVKISIYRRIKSHMRSTKYMQDKRFFVVTQFAFKRRESLWNNQQDATVNFGAAKLVLYVIEKKNIFCQGF